MYSVSLSNQDCIFDSASGFQTAKEAMQWALGRGGSYVAQLQNDEVFGAFWSFPISDDQIKTYDGWDWIDVELDSVDEYV